MEGGSFLDLFRLLVNFLFNFQVWQWSGLEPPADPGVASEGGEVPLLCQAHNQPLLLLSQEELRHPGYKRILSTQKHFDCEWEFSLSIDSNTFRVHISNIDQSLIWRLRIPIWRYPPCHCNQCTGYHLTKQYQMPLQLFSLRYKDWRFIIFHNWSFI